MDTVLAGLPNCWVYEDDILIASSNLHTHAQHLAQVLDRLDKSGAKVNRLKCQLATSSVKFLGYNLTSDGLSTLVSKTDSLRKLPSPKTKDEVRSVVGMLNYYGKFLPNMSQLIRPLHTLLRTGTTFNWSSECETSLRQAIDIIAKPPILRHFDETQKLVLSTDACGYGIGAVLSQQNQPLCFASRTLLPAETRYAVIEREAMAILFGCLRFHLWLFGRNFVVTVDHRPLLGILSPDSALPDHCSPRLLKIAMKLQRYNFTLEYLPGKFNAVADALSRLPEAQNVQANSIEVEWPQLPLHIQELAQATKEDSQLLRIMDLVINGWTNYDKQDEGYHRRREELTVHEGCLFLGPRYVPPTKFRKQIIVELHQGHPGISRMKSLARSYLWWPGLDSDIELAVKTCVPCQLDADSPPSTPHPWAMPTTVWSRIHVDFAGPWRKRIWFLLVDAFSKWPEIVPVSTTSTSAAITALASIFARFGYPECLVSDNGTAFTSAGFKAFCTAQNIRHVTSAPYHPNSNGEVERLVRCMKGVPTELDPVLDIVNWLQRYRVTPHTITGVSPASKMLVYPVRFTLSSLKMHSAVKISTPSSTRFTVGQAVWCATFKTPAWAAAEVLKVISKTMCEVSMNGLNVRRHTDQLRPRW